MLSAGRARRPVGVAERPWTRAELWGLLQQARTHHAETAVTGMLLYRHGRFLQLIEGAEDVVRRLYASIVADPLARDVTTVREGRRLLRQFPTWTIAFRDLGEHPLHSPGCSGDLNGDGGCPDKAADDLVARLQASDGVEGPAVTSVGFWGSSAGGDLPLTRPTTAGSAAPLPVFGSALG